MPFKFTPTQLPEVILIEPRVFDDRRGYFLESYKQSDFKNKTRLHPGLKNRKINAGFCNICQPNFLRQQEKSHHLTPNQPPLKSQFHKFYLLAQRLVVCFSISWGNRKIKL